VAELERGVRPWLKPCNAEHAAGRITRPLRSNLDDATGEESERDIPFMKGYTVFNVAEAPLSVAKALIQSASYPRSASSIDPDFRRDKRLKASRLS
jgi:hypothetical protein